MSRPQGSFSAANHFSKPARGDGKDDDDIVRPLVGGVSSSRSSTLNILVILGLFCPQAKMMNCGFFQDLCFCVSTAHFHLAGGREERVRQEGRVNAPTQSRGVLFIIVSVSLCHDG